MSIAFELYDDILYRWETDVPYFLMWLVEVCAIHREDETYQVMKQEVTTEEDLTEFVNLFDGDFNNIKFTINKFLSNRLPAA